MIHERYEVVKKIGEGATATVFLLWDKLLERYVAAKCGTDKEVLCAEAKYMAMAVSGNVPSLYDYVENQEMGILFMEYILGETLSDRLNRIEIYTTEEAIQILVEVAKMLGVIHHAQTPCVYGDLKPENIMIQPDGRVRLIDLGAVTKIDEHGTQEGRKKKRGATQGYAAPEVWSSKPDIRNDIYSLGKLMMFFAHHATGLLEHKEYMRIAEKCTAKELKYRYANMDEFLSDMEILLRQK